ncbi:MAG: putative transporter ATP-binding protein, partial [Hyphomicrobiales bacterium]|nr:putative transporter ATP-binding protein [Hyphomicrobiales bacterium]
AKAIDAAAARMKKFEDLMSRIDDALAKPGAFAKDPARAGQLAQQRHECEKALGLAEEEWLTLTEELEGAGA